MKFRVPNYSCLQNPWLGGYRPQILVLSVLNRICWTSPYPPEQNSWVRHCLAAYIIQDWQPAALWIHSWRALCQRTLHCIGRLRRDNRDNSFSFVHCTFPPSRGRNGTNYVSLSGSGGEQPKFISSCFIWIGISVVGSATGCGLGGSEFESLQEKIFSLRQNHPYRLWSKAVGAWSLALNCI
jgi:hypothetical protein